MCHMSHVTCQIFFGEISRWRVCISVVSTVQFPLCSVHCEVSTLQCPLCSVHCEVSSVQFPLCSVHCEVSTVKYPLCSFHCAVSTVKYPLCSVHCALSTVKYPLCSVHYEVSSVQCSVEDELGSKSAERKSGVICQQPLTRGLATKTPQQSAACKFISALHRIKKTS